MTSLVLNQFFYPDLAATSLYVTDVARAMGPGVEGLVICGECDYLASVGDEDPGVDVIRLATLPFTQLAKGKRFVSYLSFLFPASWTALRVPRHDIVVTMTTPPLLSLVGLLVQKLRGSRHFIWEMDVYPDIGFDLGALRRDHPVSRVLVWLADLARRNADGIIVLGECMKARMMAHGIAESKLHVVENWADGTEVTPGPFPAGERLVVHYSGNLGQAHDEATLRAVIGELAGDVRFGFVIAGGGSRRAELRAWCEARGVGNVEFRGYCGREELSASLAEGHVGLVTQLGETLGSMVPSKTYAILAAGRPVLSIGPKEGTPAAIVGRHGCGWHFENGDVAGVVELLRGLQGELGAGAGPGNRMVEAGARARKVLEAEYERAIGVGKILQVLGIPGKYVEAGWGIDAGEAGQISGAVRDEVFSGAVHGVGSEYGEVSCRFEESA